MNRRAWTLVAFASGLYVLSFTDRVVLSLLVEPIRGEILMSDTQFSLLFGLGFATLYILAGLPLATLVDRGNRRNIIFAGVVFWSASTLLAGFSTSYWHLLVTRSGVAVGEAALTPAVVSMIADHFSREKRALPTSIYMAVGAVSGTGAFIVGAMLVALSDAISVPLGLSPWRLVLLLIGTLGIVIGCVFAIVVKEPARVAERVQQASARDTARHVLDNAGVYLGMFAGAGFILMFAQSVVAWLPTLLVRAYDIAPGRAGLIVGLSAAPVSLLGTLSVPLLLKRFDMARAPHRLFQLAMAAALLSLPFVLVARSGLIPLMAAMLPAALGFAANAVLSPVLVQFVTPGAMRGRLVALYLVVMSILSVGVGPLVTSYGAQFFSGGNALGGGLVVTAALAIFCALCCFLYGRKRSMSYNIM